MLALTNRVPPSASQSGRKSDISLMGGEERGEGRNRLVAFALCRAAEKIHCQDRPVKRAAGEEGSDGSDEQYSGV
jgi:hypothetical protein